MRKLIVLVLALGVLMTINASIIKISANPPNSTASSKGSHGLAVAEGVKAEAENRMNAETKNKSQSVVYVQEAKRERADRPSDQRNGTKPQNNQTKESDKTELAKGLVKNQVKSTQQPKKDTQANHTEPAKRGRGARLLQSLNLNYNMVGEGRFTNIQNDTDAINAYNKLLSHLNITNSTTVEVISVFRQSNNGVTNTFQLKIQFFPKFFILCTYVVNQKRTGNFQITNKQTIQQHSTIKTIDPYSLNLKNQFKPFNREVMYYDATFYSKGVKVLEAKYKCQLTFIKALGYNGYFIVKFQMSPQTYLVVHLICVLREKNRAFQILQETITNS